MPWIQVRLDTTSDHAEILENLLLEILANSHHVAIDITSFALPFLAGDSHTTASVYFLFYFSGFDLGYNLRC